MIYVGGLSSRYHWSINPFGGSLELSVPIRNASPDTLDVVAVFSANNLFGGHVGSKEKVVLLDIKPGETKTISGQVNGLGQWALVKSQVEVSRMGEEDAWGLGTVNRDRWVFFLPWFLVLLAVLLLVGAFYWRRRRKARVLAAQSSDTQPESPHLDGNNGASTVEAGVRGEPS